MDEQKYNQVENILIGSAVNLEDLGEDDLANLIYAVNDVLMIRIKQRLQEADKRLLK